MEPLLEEDDIVVIDRADCNLKEIPLSGRWFLVLENGNRACWDCVCQCRKYGKQEALLDERGRNRYVLM